MASPAFFFFFSLHPPSPKLTAALSLSLPYSYLMMDLFRRGELGLLGGGEGLRDDVGVSGISWSANRLPEDVYPASGLALAAAYHDIKTRLASLERENSSIKRKLKHYEVKVDSPRALTVKTNPNVSSGLCKIYLSRFILCKSLGFFGDTKCSALSNPEPSSWKVTVSSPLVSHDQRIRRGEDPVLFL